MKKRIILHPVRVHPDVKTDLETIAAYRQDTVSDVIRDAIARLIEKEKEVGALAIVRAK